MMSRRNVWVLNLVALWVLFFQGQHFVARLTPPPRDSLGDFFQEWASATNWRYGHPVYDHQANSADRYLGLRAGPDQILYIEWNAHPPASVLAVLPLAYWPYIAALAIWHAISALCMAISIAWIARELNWRIQAWMALPLLAAAVISNPIVQQFNHGQWNGVLLLLVVGGWAKLRRGRDATAGVLIGVAAALKLFPLFLLVGPAFGRRIRAALWGTAVFAGCNMAAWWTLGSTAFVDYLSIVRTISNFRASWLNHSVVGVATRWFQRLDPDRATVFVPDRPLLDMPALFAIGLATAAAIVGVEMMRWRRALSRDAMDAAYSSSVVAMSLLSPLSWDHGLVLLILPACVVGRWIFAASGFSAWLFAGALFILNLNWAVAWKKVIEHAATVWPIPNAMIHLVYCVPFAALFGLYIAVCQAQPAATQQLERELDARDFPNGPNRKTS